MSAIGFNARETQVLRAAPRRGARLRGAALSLTSRLDPWLIGSTAGIVIIGTLLVWSATSGAQSGVQGATQLGSGSLVLKHVVNVLIGCGLAAGLVLTRYRWVRFSTPLLYLASVAGLVLVLVAGATINGSQSWLRFGGLSIQPAEFAKLAVVAGMALLVAERTEATRKGLDSLGVIGMLAVAGLPAALILLQPDLGTMLVLTATVFGTLAVAGASARWLGALLLTGVAAAVSVVQLGMLKPYQIDRFMAFTDPSLDPRGAGYNTTQARIAIGNGGWLGQGLFDGSQTNAGFVPAQHTDFIFTVAGEELGLLGAGALILLFAVLLWRALAISKQASDLFGRVAAAGIACWLGFQAFQNIGMCLGIMPVTGVPLPLVSYGGTSMFASLMAVGLLQNIAQGREAPVNRASLR